MVDVVGEVLYYAALPVALTVMALAVWWLRGSWLLLRLAAAGSLAVAAFLVLTSLSWAMALRDGLGPDGIVHSEGIQALRKSLAELPSPLLIAAAGFAAPGAILVAVSLRRLLVVD